jgi:hypothetical protein
VLPRSITTEVRAGGLCVRRQDKSAELLKTCHWKIGKDI